MVLVALVGWLWGSFLNQLIDRTPYRDAQRVVAPALKKAGEGQEAGGAGDGEGGEQPGWFWPARSICFHCGVVLRWFDNLPLFSWLWLGGRCRHCGGAIGLRTLVVEGLTPLGLVAWHVAFVTLLPLAGAGCPAFLNMPLLSPPLSPAGILLEVAVGFALSGLLLGVVCRLEARRLTTAAMFLFTGLVGTAFIPWVVC